MNDNYFVLAFLGFWAVVMLVHAHHNGRRRHERHLERMAMIERGLTPPPEPASGVLADVFEGLPHSGGPRSPNHVKTVARNAGVILLSLGVGVGLLLWNASGNTARAFAVAAVLLSLSVAFFVISWLEPTRPEADVRASDLSRTGHP